MNRLSRALGLWKKIGAGLVAGVMVLWPGLVASAAEPDEPTFRIFAYPNTPWRYDEELGERYNVIWGSGAIVRGAFQSFTFQEPVSQYGTYGPSTGSYLKAGRKIALFGSSF